MNSADHGLKSGKTRQDSRDPNHSHVDSESYFLVARPRRAELSQSESDSSDTLGTDIRDTRNCIASRRGVLSLASLVRAFGSALVAHVAGLRFCVAGFVVRLGPMTAIRAEMPCIAIAFTSIGFVHGVRMLFLRRF